MTTENCFVSLKAGLPLSVTRTCTTFVVFACETVGRQANAPLLELMAAPLGGLTRLNASVFVGISGSTAVAVKLIVCPGFTVRLVNGPAPRVGAEFVSFTVTIKLFVAVSDLELIAGGFVSATIIVMV